MSAKDTGVPDVYRERLTRLLDIQRRLNQERSMARLPGVVMHAVTELMGADRSTLFLLDRATMELRACFAEGVGGGKTLVVPLRMGVIGTAILQRRTINLANAYQHPYFNPEIDALSGYKTDSILVVPIFDANGLALGGLELLNKPTGRFTAEDERIVEDVVRQLAAAADGFAPDAVRTKLQALHQWIEFDRGAVFRVDPDQGRLVAVYAEGAEGIDISMNMRLGIAGLVALANEALLIPDAHADPRFDASFDRRTGYLTRNILCVPLRGSDGEAIGVIQVINKLDGTPDAADLDLLSCIGGAVAIAIENAMMFEENELQFRSLLDTLAASIDARDTLTAGHSLRVARIAKGIAGQLDFAAHDLDLLEVAAVLHDYGKIGVDDVVLKKAGKLDDQEFTHMKQHAHLTFDILDRIRFTRKYRTVPLIAASHHENLDGSGYPRGLKANEIPFLAKILSVADVFEALTADRHYRRGMEVAQALEIIRGGVGKKFEARVVDALHDFLDAGGRETLELQ